MSKPIVVEVTRQDAPYPKGAELGYESEAQARSVLGDAFKITRYQDGTEYVAPKSATRAQDAPKSGNKG